MANTTHAAPAAAETPAVTRLIARGGAELEPVRFAWLLAYLAAWAAGVGGALAAHALYRRAPADPATWGVAAGATAAAVLVAAAVAGGRRVRLHAGFDAWRADLVRALDADAEFDAGRAFSAAEFDATGLIGRPYTRYAGSDWLAVGPLRACNLAVDHVRTETYYVTVSGTDAHGRSSSREEARTRTVVEPVFHGLLVARPAALPCPARVVLTAAEPAAGLRPFAVASPDLNRHYRPAADDPFAGHRTLTPVVQEAVWRFRGRFRQLPLLAYAGGRLYVAVPGATLDCGARPGRWRPVTAARLRRVADRCRAAVEFVRTATADLVPETP